MLGHVQSNNKNTQFQDGDGQLTFKYLRYVIRSMMGRVQLMKGGQVILIMVSDKLTIELKIDTKEMLGSRKGVQVVQIRRD